MQLFCRHCREPLLRMRGKLRCPHGCRDPLPEFSSPHEELTDYFRRSQFMCPCCGECSVDARLLSALENLRSIAGKDIEIVSGFRCPRQSEHVLGPSRLAHLHGRAADIRIPGLSLEQMYELADKVYDFRHGGIGLNDDKTLHVDVRVFRARWQRVGGKYLGLGIKLCP